MDATTLVEFRHRLYATCFTRARAALFDFADALLTDTHAHCFVELSQAASFRRAWPSLAAGAYSRGQWEVTMHWFGWEMTVSVPRKNEGDKSPLSIPP